VTPAGHPLKGTHKVTYYYPSLPLSRNAQLSSSIKTLINRLSSRKNFLRKCAPTEAKLSYLLDGLSNGTQEKLSAKMF
jgi:hypothetical protein